MLVIALLLTGHLYGQPQEPVCIDIWIDPGEHYDIHQPLELRVERGDGKEPTRREIEEIFREVRGKDF